TQFGELMEQELRLKREATERVFETQAEKNRTLMRLEELRGFYENKEVGGVIWCYDKESGVGVGFGVGVDVAVGVMLMFNYWSLAIYYALPLHWSLVGFEPWARL
nr:hypothetical protein [Tanacetum cinerariifolium]